MGHGSQQERPNLAGVAPDDIRPHLAENLPGSVSAKVGATRPDGVKNHGFSQFFRGFSRQKQGLNLPGTGGSQIQDQTVAGRCDLLYLFQILRHNGGRAAGQRQIGTVVGCYQIHHAVNQRVLFSGFL